MYFGKSNNRITSLAQEEEDESVESEIPGVRRRCESAMSLQHEQMPFTILETQSTHDDSGSSHYILSSEATYIEMVQAFPAALPHHVIMGLLLKPRCRQSMEIPFPRWGEAR